MATRALSRVVPLDGEALRLEPATPQDLETAALREQTSSGRARGGDRGFIEALASDSPDGAAARASAAGCDLMNAHVLLHIEPARRSRGSASWPRLAMHTGARIRRLEPRAIYEAGARSAYALISLSGPTATLEQLARLDREFRKIAAQEEVVVGRSEVRAGRPDVRRSLDEASAAAMTAQTLPGAGALSHSELGVYTYLVRLARTELPRDRFIDGVERLIEYDARRRAELVRTLEQYLQKGRRISATARGLYIHPNTLRQRLDRIQKVSGLELASDDHLALELAIKLVALRSAMDDSDPS